MNIFSNVISLTRERFFTSNNPCSSIYYNWFTAHRSRHWKWGIQGQDCLERDRKYIHALCRINFNFMWVRQQQHSFPRCVYKHKCVNECLWGIGIFPQHKHCTLTAHEQRFRKMCVLVLVLPLHHKVLENTVKLSKLQSPPLYNLSLDHTSSISSPNPNLLSYFIRIPAVFFSYCFLPLRCKDAITLRVKYFFLN